MPVLQRFKQSQLLSTTDVHIRAGLDARRTRATDLPDGVRHVLRASIGPRDTQKHRRSIQRPVAGASHDAGLAQS